MVNYLFEGSELLGTKDTGYEFLVFLDSVTEIFGSVYLREFRGQVLRHILFIYYS
jgi:hypothetical protein